MPLRSIDTEELRELGLPFSSFDESGATFVELPGFTYSPAYAPASGALLLRLPAGFSVTPPDMFWTQTGVRLASNNAEPDRAGVIEVYDGRQWQRWSRHWQTWQQTFTVRHYIATVRRELGRGR